MTVTVSPRRITYFLTIILALLFVAGVLGQSLVLLHILTPGTFLGTAHKFDLDAEQTIPNWYSSIIILFTAVLLACISLVKRRQRAPYCRHWLALAVIFVLLSIDESAAIHDMAAAPFRSALHTHGVLYYAWVIPAIALVLFVGLAYLPFVLHLPAVMRRRLIVAGGVYVGAALGLEMIGGYLAENYGRETFFYLAESAIEETLEMAGIVIFIHALLSYLSTQVDRIELTFDTTKPMR